MKGQSRSCWIPTRLSEVEQPPSEFAGHPPWPLFLVRRLHFHGVGHPELSGSSFDRSSGRGAKSARGNFYVVNIRRAVALDGEIVSRDQLIERSVLTLASLVAALGVGNGDQVILHAGDGRDFGMAAAGRRRLQRCDLQRIEVHGNRGHNHRAEKSEDTHRLLPGLFQRLLHREPPRATSNPSDGPAAARQWPGFPWLRRRV